MVEDKKCKHQQITIHLDEFSSSQVKKLLRDYLEYAKTELKHCPNCGGLTPELVFITGKDNDEFRYVFAFTCHITKELEKVESTGKNGLRCIDYKETKTLMETDYEKFLKFLQVTLPKPTEKAHAEKR